MYGMHIGNESYVKRMEEELDENEDGNESGSDKEGEVCCIS